MKGPVWGQGGEAGTTLGDTCHPALGQVLEYNIEGAVSHQEYFMMLVALWFLTSR